MRFLQFEGVISGLSQRQVSCSQDIEEDSAEFLGPWTRKMILKPVRNRKCGHLYDSETVPRYPWSALGGCSLQLPAVITRM